MVWVRVHSVQIVTAIKIDLQKHSVHRIWGKFSRLMR